MSRDIYNYLLRLRISSGLFSADRSVTETVTEPAMRLFQRLALDKNQLAINSATVTVRSISRCNQKRSKYELFVLL